MSRGSTRALALAALFVPLFARGALADTPPSQWDRARAPSVGEAWDLHVRVSQELTAAHQARSLSYGADPERRPALKAIEMRHLSIARDDLEEANAATGPDVRLRFDLGEVYGDMEHYGAAIQVLEAALALAPEHTAAPSAWGALAAAHAKLDHTRDEIRAYDKILAVAVDLGTRAEVTGNRAEAEMRLGNLDEAVDGYRESIALSESVSGSQSLYESGVLARWGLAVALDRSGDPAGASREAALAVAQNGFHVIKRPYVFYVPDYEENYYLALGWTVRAQGSTGPKDAVEAWGYAEDFWGAYASGAEDAQTQCERVRPRACVDDRWLPLARAHLEHARKARAQAEKRGGIKREPRGHLGREVMIQ